MSAETLISDSVNVFAGNNQLTNVLVGDDDTRYEDCIISVDNQDTASRVVTIKFTSDSGAVFNLLNAVTVPYGNGISFTLARRPSFGYGTTGKIQAQTDAENKVCIGVDFLKRSKVVE